MTLRRLRNSPYWIACLTLPDGKRTNRSTKTTDRKLAQRLANEWQMAATQAREGAFVEAQARKVLNEILAHVGQDSIPHETAESFFRQWMAGKSEGNTARRYASTVEKFLESIGHKRHGRLDAIGHQEVLNFIATREEEGVAPKTLVVDVRTIGAAFNVARKLGLIAFNPAERALTIRPIAAESSHRGIFSEEQVAALINAAQGEWKTLILLGYYTGARLGDCAKMQWGCVDIARGVIDFVPEKTRRKNKRIVVPLHPVLLAHIQAFPISVEPEAFLCPTLANKTTGGKNGLSALFRRIMDGAGVDSKTSQGLGLRQFSKLSFHALRHSFTSGLANAGISAELRMKLTGHSSEAVHRGYTHHELEVLKSAVCKLPSLY
jgi:integrase